MTSRIYFCLLFVTAHATNAVCLQAEVDRNSATQPLATNFADTLHKTIEKSIRIQYVLRDKRDLTLVQTMIQVDDPPTDMIFVMSLRAGDSVWTLGRVSWSKGRIRGFAFHTDLPVDLKAVDVLLTPNSPTAAKLTRKNQPSAEAPEGNGENVALVFPGIKVRRQRISMVTVRQPSSQTILREAFAQLDPSDPVYEHLKSEEGLKQARSLLRQRLDDNPQDARAMYVLGCLEHAAGNPIAALQYFAETRRLNPTTLSQQQIQRQLRQLCAIQLHSSKKDDLEAMCVLGAAYEQGWGVGQDYQNAKYWYRNATNAGHPEAMRRLGAMYAKQLGATVQTEQAKQWYRDQTRLWYQQSAKLGDKEAQQWLATHKGS